MKKRKKMASSAAALISVTVAAGITAYAVQNYSPEDLRRLSSSILGESELSDGQDVNRDGRVDVYDLVEMRRSFLNSGEFYSNVFPATQENVRYIGRNFYSGDTAWLVQSGSAIEFTVTGRAVSINLSGDSYTSDDEKYSPRYAILVDGEVVADSLLPRYGETVTLFKGDVSRTVTVQVIHLSEANNGAVGVSGIMVDSNVPEPITPTPKKDLQIEFIGDSITCAYGVEGKDQYENFMTSTENFMKSYAYLTAKQLNADYSAVCYSGHGIISGYSSDGNKYTDSLVPDYYDYVGKLKDYQLPWDFEGNENDVVVINLGTNDDSYATKDLENRAPEFAEKYEEFLEQVHERNPNAYIICTLGTMGCTELYPYIEEAVESFRKTTGYERIMSYQSAVQDAADGMGSDWHPSAITQQNSAYVLADKICQALGMESDQIGIDVAADVKFDSTQTDSAMMSAWFSEWDGSYHITTVAGGESKDSIRITAGKIGLKKNGVYKLQFKIDTSAGEEIPFALKNAETGDVLFEDTFVGTGEKTLYEAEIICPQTCDGELEFLMGGTDSLRLSLYDLKMVKTK